MKLLLDTHIWLWALGEPSRLWRRVREEIRKPENEFWLSPVSTWEASATERPGSDSAPAQPGEMARQVHCPLREAPFTNEIVLLAQQLPLPHHDPADRFLAATAQVMNLTLVTGDDKLLGLGTFLNN